jgi:hypothetical protein
MIDLMNNLEPRFEEKDEIMYDELDEITEVILFVRGKYDVGFEINGKRHFVKRY